MNRVLIAKKRYDYLSGCIMLNAHKTYIQYFPVCFQLLLEKLLSSFNLLYFYNVNITCDAHD